MTALAFSPDGQTVASSGFKTLLWNVAIGKTVVEIDYPEMAALAFSPDGKYLASSPPQRVGSTSIMLREAATGTLVLESKTPSTPPAWPFGPEANSWWPAPTAAASRSWTCPSTTSSAFSTKINIRRPRPPLIRAGNGWQRATMRARSIFGKPKPASGARRLPGHPGDNVSKLAFSPDGSILASSGNRGLRVWDVAQGKEIARSAGGTRTLRFSGDGKTILVDKDLSEGRGEFFQYNLIDAATGKLLAENVWGLLSPDGRWFAHPQEKSNIDLLDAGTGKLVRTLQTERQQFAFSPDSKILAVGTKDDVTVWDVSTGKPIGQPLRHEKDPSIGLVFPAALAFTPDGNRLAWDSRLWDWKQTKDSVHFGNPGRTASSIFAASGKVLLTAPADRNLRDRVYVWDVASRQLRSILSLPEELLRPGPRFHVLPGGSVLLEEKVNDRWVIWDAETDVRTRFTPRGAGELLAVSPDGRQAVFGRYGVPATLWAIPPQGK